MQSEMLFAEDQTIADNVLELIPAMMSADQYPTLASW